MSFFLLTNIDDCELCMSEQGRSLYLQEDTKIYILVVSKQNYCPFLFESAGVTIHFFMIKK